MKKIVFLLLVNLINKDGLFAQAASDSLLALGNTFYKKGEFDSAGKLWTKAAELARYKISKQSDYYYAANAYAYGKDTAGSFRCLEMAIIANGFNDLQSLENDDAFKSMKGMRHWHALIKSIKPVYISDPHKVKIIDTDIRNFWSAFDEIKKSKGSPEEIYTKIYFEKGTMALEDYFVHKIGNVENFVIAHHVKEKYYESIRTSTLNVKSLEPVFQRSFIKLKKIYPQAVFPPVYFVIGKLNSAGTNSAYGLILALDQASKSASADTSELTTWEKNNISKFQDLPHTVAHELIHFLQNAMASDTSLLKAALIEGMADFIGELISGKTANERLKLYAKGREKQIWADFKKEMLNSNTNNWIANADQETADKPADLGYWVGYEICKSFYQHAKNKQRAVYAMLHIKDYRQFLKESKFE